MSTLQDAAVKLDHVLHSAEMIANAEGSGDFSDVSVKGNIFKGEAVEVTRLAGLPGQWGPVYETMRRNLALAFTTLIESGRGDMVEPAELVIYICHHCPSVEDIRDRAVRPHWHRDPDLALDATPLERARWIVKNHKAPLVNLIGRIHILEAMAYPEHASTALATIEAKAPRTLENLSDFERCLIRSLHHKGAKDDNGKIALGEIKTTLRSLLGVDYGTDQTIRRRLKDLFNGGLVVMTGKKYNLSNLGWSYGEQLRKPDAPRM